MMSDRLESKKVTIEEVLRLKRAERPEAPFWDQFEQQLRAKQLAAIVNRRPWWHFDLARLTAGVSKLRVPLGATAVLALTVVTVREYRTPDSAVLAQPRSDLVEDRSPGAPAFEGRAVAMADETVSSSVPSPAGASPVVSSTYSSETPSVGLASTQESSSTASSLPWLGDVGVESLPPLVAGGTGMVAAFSDRRSTPWAMDESMDPGALALNPLSQVSRSHELVEPLTQVTAPTESRRARLAALVAPASLKDAYSKTPSDRVRDRMISRLSEDELYNSVNRLGVAKGGLSLNF